MYEFHEYRGSCVGGPDLLFNDAVPDLIFTCIDDSFTDSPLSNVILNWLKKILEGYGWLCDFSVTSELPVSRECHTHVDRRPYLSSHRCLHRLDKVLFKNYYFWLFLAFTCSKQFQGWLWPSIKYPWVRLYSTRWLVKHLPSDAAAAVAAVGGDAAPWHCCIPPDAAARLRVLPPLARTRTRTHWLPASQTSCDSD